MLHMALHVRDLGRSYRVELSSDGDGHLVQVEKRSRAGTAYLATIKPHSPTWERVIDLAAHEAERIGTLFDSKRRVGR